MYVCFICISLIFEFGIILITMFLLIVLSTSTFDSPPETIKSSRGRKQVEAGLHP